MADFDALDGRLREALQQAAQQGDSAGVADAIRARVAAGDAGTSAAGSTAPGWGGGAGAWMPWLGLIVVGALVGGVAGVSGAVGRPEGETVVDIPVAIGDSAPIAACADGPIVGRIPAGTRALAVERSDDSLWVGIRDPRTLGGTLWVALGDISLDDGTPALAELPVGGACPEPAVVTLPAPEPVPSEEPAPQPNPPAPTPDTTAPSIGNINVQWSNCYFLVTVPVSDNVGVASVNISWSGVPGGSSRPMTPQGGGVWRLEVSGSSNVYGGNYTFTVVATDSAGNSSQRVSAPTNIQCLI